MIKPWRVDAQQPYWSQTSPRWRRSSTRLLEERSYTSEKDEIDHEVSITDRVYELLCIVEDDLRRLDPSIQPVLEDYGSWVLLHDVIRLNPTRVVAGLRFLRCHLKLMENPQINIARLARRAELNEDS